MDFDDFKDEFEESLDQKIDSIRSEYPAMFDLVEKKMPIKNIPEMEKLLNAYNQAVNKSVKIVEKFREEILRMWDPEDYIKNRMEEDPNLKRDDISDEEYWADMEFLTDDYFENTADQDLVQSIKDAKEWEWDNEYEFRRKFKEYVEDLHTINNNLINSFQEIKHDSVMLIFEDSSRNF